MSKRTKPYTEIGIGRIKCCRDGCNNKATQQWQVCSDDNQYRPVCDDCDIEINRMVVTFMFPSSSKAIINAYKEELNGN